MRGPEQAGPERPKEREIAAYHRTARFETEPSSRQAYFAARDAIFTDPENELSTYRLNMPEGWHVTVLGEEPVEELRNQLEQILAAGTPASLPEDLLERLTLRRKEATKEGEWVERHRRGPGIDR